MFSNSILHPLPLGPAVFNDVQPKNALLPIVVTLFGIVIDARDVQFKNA